jgi:ABC-type polysaccharide/polyol phosphate transport system ATPase subunit
MIPMDTVFKLTHVSVSFAQRKFTPQSLKHTLANFFIEKEQEKFNALTNVSLTIRGGEHVGVIGRNGAGKSTLLRVMTRVIIPQEGGVYANSYKHIVPLLELGIGFHPDLSGRENCLLSGILMGYSPNEMQTKMDGIIAFSELGQFFDQPVKTYSSGMYARLAFALATDIEPEVLLIDEVFGVGDEFFMKKCIIRMQQLMNAGTTTVFVSHNLDFLATQCNRLVWLESGMVVMDGKPAEVAAAYRGLEAAA